MQCIASSKSAKCDVGSEDGEIVSGVFFWGVRRVGGFGGRKISTKEAAFEKMGVGF